MFLHWSWFGPGWSNKDLLGTFSVPTLNRGLYADLLRTINFRDFDLDSNSPQKVPSFKLAPKWLRKSP